MRLVCCPLVIAALFALNACGKLPSPPAAQSAPSAQSPTPAPASQASSQASSKLTAQPSPQAPGAAAPSATPVTTIAGKPVVTPPPADPNAAKVAAQAKPLPPSVMEKLTRPLTLEEINRLPPDVRDMILRAQGRLPASPAPKQSPKK
jgi:predicted small lipoprotein YifL